jgi:hypothetical protein
MLDHPHDPIVAAMIRDGMSHRAVAAKTGIPISTVGKIAKRTGARRTDGELRGGPRVYGHIDHARRHRALPRETCVNCTKRLPTHLLASGWCATCLRTPPLTRTKVDALAQSFCESLVEPHCKASALVFAAALLLPGKVWPESIQAIVGESQAVQDAIRRYTDQGFFSKDGHLCLEECPDDATDILFSLALMCGAGLVHRHESE